MDPHDIFLAYVDVQETFLIADLKIEDNGCIAARHLLFITKFQLDILRECSTIYCDGTFKCTRDPFKQLYGVHTFLRCGSNIKQIPVLNILMSQRRKVDYDTVFTHVRRILGEE